MTHKTHKDRVLTQTWNARQTYFTCYYWMWSRCPRGGGTPGSGTRRWAAAPLSPAPAPNAARTRTSGVTPPPSAPQRAGWNNRSKIYFVPDHLPYSVPSTPSVRNFVQKVTYPMHATIHLYTGWYQKNTAMFNWSPCTLDWDVCRGSALCRRGRPPCRSPRGWSGPRQGTSPVT